MRFHSKKTCIKNAALCDNILVCQKCKGLIAWSWHGDVVVFPPYVGLTALVKEKIQELGLPERENSFENEMKTEVMTIIRAAPEYEENDDDFELEDEELEGSDTL